MLGVQWLTAFRLILAALISNEVSFNYQWENHFWSVIYALLTILSIPHERLPFVHAIMIAADRIIGSILGCAIGLASYVFLATVVLEDYFFWLVDITIVMNVLLGAYIYSASKQMQMTLVSAALILSMSFISEDITDIVLIFVSEIMVGVVVGSTVYIVTLPLFFWHAKASHRHQQKLQKLTDVR